MKHTNQDFTLLQKAKMVGIMAAVGFIAVVGAGGYTVYQREAEAEAVKTAAVQLANVEALKTTFPVFRGKGIEDMAIKKVSQSELPKTITATFINTACIPSDGPPTETGWIIDRDGEYDIAGSNDKRGFDVTDGGSITIPAGSPPDTYHARFFSLEECEDGYLNYYYDFKITPPCPTGVTLSVSATPQ